jgi:hypothetical protein
VKPPVTASRHPNTLAKALSVSLLGSLLSLVGVERAAVAAEVFAPKVRIDVRAAPSCTSRSELVARVLERAPRIQFVEDDSSGRVQADFTELRNGDVAGTVVLVRPDATPSTRRVVARSCSQAADAIALIIAVSFDPESVSSATASNGEASATSASTPAAAKARTNDDDRPGAKPQSPAGEPSTQSERVNPPEAASGRAGAEELDTATAEPASARARRFSFGAHVAAQTVFGPAPAVLPGVSLYGLVELGGDSIWWPALLIGVMHAWRAGFEEPGGDASFLLDAATLDLCPVKFEASRLHVRACGSALFGRLSVEGSSTRNPAGALSRPFALAGGAAIVALRLDSRVELTARLALGSTLVRDSFEFTPVVFHTVSPVTVLASVGIGLTPR